MASSTARYIRDVFVATVDFGFALKLFLLVFALVTGTRLWGLLKDDARRAFSWTWKIALGAWLLAYGVYTLRTVFEADVIGPIRALARMFVRGVDESLASGSTLYAPPVVPPPTLQPIPTAVPLPPNPAPKPPGWWGEL
jgi:hypothetical protein